MTEGETLPQWLMALQWHNRQQWWIMHDDTYEPPISLNLNPWQSVRPSHAWEDVELSSFQSLS